MGDLMENSRKHERVLEIYSRLLSGDIVNKYELAEEYGVNPRSVQRDIDAIREFYSNRTVDGEGVAEIQYDRRAKGYRLVQAEGVRLNQAELFTVVKILLESRSLNQAEMKSVIQKLLNTCLPCDDRKKMKELVANELYHYVEPRHGEPLIENIWSLANTVYTASLVDLTYQKTNGNVTHAVVKPVGIMCSEYYFYLIAYIGENDKTHPGYPTVYRIDRIKEYKVLDEHFHMPYQNRFQEGEFRKRIPFMFTGKLHKTSFIYTGADINAVLDRLPTAVPEKLDDGSWKVTVEVYGELGLNLWLKGQGTAVREDTGAADTEEAFDTKERP